MYDMRFPPASNRADWIVDVELIDDDTGELITDLSGVGVYLEVRDKDHDRYRRLTGSTDDGHITILPSGFIEWKFTASEMRTLRPGTYDIGVIVTRDDSTEQEIIGFLPVLDGVVR